METRFFCFLKVIYLQVYVPGVMACSAHVERGNLVAVSVAVEQPSVDGGWAKGITRGTIMQGLSTGRNFFHLVELINNPFLKTSFNTLYLYPTVVNRVYYLKRSIDLFQ